MKTTTFQRHWIDIADRLGLDIELNHAVEVGDTELTVPVLLLGYGAPKGMLLVSEFDLIRDLTNELVNLGYGFSRLGEPASGPIDWDTVKEMLRDWGACN